MSGTQLDRVDAVTRDEPAAAIDRAATSDGDLGLLRRYEPIIRYTRGELFLPTSVEDYVRCTSMWRLDTGADPTCVVPSGQHDVGRMVDEAIAHPDADLSLRFVDRAFSRSETRAWRHRPHRPGFSSHGRFARVGLFSRLLDAGFRLGLLLRGRVPGGLAAAAEQRAQSMLDCAHHPYYGRVVCDGGYVVLQYWFFYAMNDWRSSFGGANDHEADWEQVTLYLTKTEGGPRPAWVACSAHDEVGDDLRRRWDDPEVTRDGDHTVIFAGAGSHSGAFVPGEYVTAVQPPGRLAGVLRIIQAVAHLITPWSKGALASGVGIPFVDYARGDGDAVGPGGTRSWTPVVIGDHTDWVREFRGLWGLDTRDRFGGERAPAGPRFERSGTVRRSWADPLGWAGLQKVPASTVELRALLEQRIVDVDMELVELDAHVATQRHDLRRLAAESASLGHHTSLAAAAVEREARMRAAERDLLELTSRRSTLRAERDAHVATIERPPPPPDPQAHLRHKAVPAGRGARERIRFLRLWSAFSVPLLFAAGAWLLIDHSWSVLASLSILTVVFLAVEAIARGRLLGFLLTLSALVVGASFAISALQGSSTNGEL